MLGLRHAEEQNATSSSTPATSLFLPLLGDSYVMEGLHNWGMSDNTVGYRTGRKKKCQLRK